MWDAKNALFLSWPKKEMEGQEKDCKRDDAHKNNEGNLKKVFFRGGDMVGKHLQKFVFLEREAKNCCCVDDKNPSF